MFECPKLSSERLTYIPLSKEHLSQDYVDWLNDTEVNKYLESGNGYTIDKLSDFLSNVESKNIYFWAIHLKSNNLHIGNIKIDPISSRNANGEYGIMMGRKSEWGKGYAKEASIRIINYCFEEIKLRKVTLGVVADNINAVALYHKIGFVDEGLYKKHAYHEGKYCDIIRMAIFNPNDK